MQSIHSIYLYTLFGSFNSSRQDDLQHHHPSSRLEDQTYPWSHKLFKTSIEKYRNVKKTYHMFWKHLRNSNIYTTYDPKWRYRNLHLCPTDGQSNPLSFSWHWISITPKWVPQMSHFLEGSWIPSRIQTWKWKIYYLKVIFLLKPLFQVHFQ